jgi:hypothetical protein
MEPNLITFRKFNDITLAYQLVDLLKKHNIEYIMEDVPGTFDPAFRTKDLETKEYLVKIKDTDFSRANSILDEDAIESINNIERDYYLFDFTNDELIDVLVKRDEWNSFDVLLSRKILKERGLNITDDELTKINNDRIETLREPEPSQSTWIIIGYVLAVLGGVLGIFIGWHLSSYKKTLPNGEQVFEYSENDRKHGKIIFYISIIVFSICFILKIAGIIEFS